ncbi:MAG: DUF3383 domain-containing protein [Silvanigrellaceae bacterium]|nr:DUF3383 domain-containing protein [Silvanigrellaceae bacterium]
MPSVSNIVEVNISKQNAVPKEESFNVPLILGYNNLAFFNDKVAQEFYDPSELLQPSVGFTSTSKEYLLTQQIFMQEPSIKKFIVGKRRISAINSAEPVKSVYKIGDDLDEIMKVNSNWYALFLADFSEKDDLLLACKWIEASKSKIGSFRSSDKNILDSSKNSDIANTLAAVGFNRSMLTYHATNNEFPEAAILGKFLSKEAGTYCLAHKNLNSLTSQNILDREFKAIQEASCNVYTEILGTPTFQDGRVLNKVTNFMDNTITEDSLRARIQARIFGTFSLVDKVPYDETGLFIIETQIKSVLDEFEKKKAILKGWEVRIPKLDEIILKYKEDRNKRELKNIWFNATINGSIQKATVNGFISY